jgi:hypothetical protein
VEIAHREASGVGGSGRRCRRCGAGGALDAGDSPSSMARRAGLSRSARTTIRTTRPSVDSGGGCPARHAGVRGGFRCGPKLYKSTAGMRDPISEDGEPSHSPRWIATKVAEAPARLRCNADGRNCSHAGMSPRCFKSDLVNARAGGYVEAREVKPPTVLASFENDIGGAFVRAQRRFWLRPVKEKPERS